MYQLIRTTPDGIEKTHSPVERARDAAVAASFSLFYNGHATKAQAQRFAAKLHAVELGTTLTHESGCTFRIVRAG